MSYARAMAKPYSLTPPGPSLRRASPTYEQPRASAPSKNFKWAPGFEQNQAPMGDVPLPNLPPTNVGPKPFRVA